MNGDILLVTHALNGLLMIALAIGVGLWLTRRFNLSWQLFWIGGVVFILSQVGHIPFNALIGLLFQRGILPAPSPQWALPFNAIFLGLSAGVFEEGARYLMYRYWTKEARWWGEGILLGAGHGGMEALILGGLVLLTYAQMIAYRGVDYHGLSPENVAVIQQYWSIPWYTSLLGAVERLFALTGHIAWSVLVLQVFIRRQLRWLVLAILWHALLDGFGAVWISQTYGIYAAEAVIGVFALLNVAIIFALRQPRPQPLEEPSFASPPVPAFIPVAPDETPENLEKTKYQ